MNKTIIAFTAVITAIGLVACGGHKKDHHMSSKASVIEVASFELNEGVTPSDFATLDQAVETDHVSQQPGFVSRETAYLDNEWLVIVHWESLDAADASMASFSGAPAAADFMNNLDATTMTMKRYTINR